MAVHRKQQALTPAYDTLRGFDQDGFRDDLSVILSALVMSCLAVDAAGQNDVHEGWRDPG